MPASDELHAPASPHEDGKATVPGLGSLHEDGEAMTPELGSLHEDGPSEDDAFQWTHERDRAIEAALGRLAEEPMSVVGRQLRDIRRALGTVGLPDAAALLDEVERFVASRQAAVAAQPTVDHPEMRLAREAMLQALGLYAEICPLLRRLAEDHDDSLARLAARLEDEATTSLLRARDLIVSSRPPGP